MKMIIFLTLFTAYQIHAEGVFGQRITLKVQQTEIKNILTLLEKQADVRFLYNYNLNSSLSKKVDYSVHDQSFEEAMNKLFQNTEFAYRLLDNKLVVILAKTEADTYKADVITGTIVGENQQPLAGVTVTVKGTNNGVSSDMKGAFRINAPADGVLVFSYVGYENKEVAIAGQTNIVVQLAISNKQLEQIVVVGYGSQRKKDLTGSVSVVTAADMANRPLVNAGEALQGKAAGVQVVSNSGKPGAGLTIRVRGSSSISAGNEPLYVVDGVPMTDISAYTTNDIESISILKDAASASIYGTRAANGVVVITTKKGVAGKSRIDFSAYYGTSSTTKKLDVLNAKQYQDYANKVLGPNSITDSMVNANNINWPDEVFRKGNQQNYQLSFSGGSEKTQHYISLGYNDQVGTIKPAKFDRLTGRVNLTTKAADWLTLSTNTIITRSHSNDVTDNTGVARGGVVLSALATPPTVPKYNADGTIGLNPFSGWQNPLGAIDGQYTRSVTDRMVSSLAADVRLAKGLLFRSSWGIDYTNYEKSFFLDPYLTTYGQSTQGQLNQTKYTEFVWLGEQTLSYTKAVGQHHFMAMAGYTVQESKYDQTYISGSKLDTAYRHKSWDEMYMLTQTKQASTKSIDEWGLVSYLGRITYDYAGKYLLQANLRSDHSSRFAPGNRNATFPSVSAGWRISQEKFMKDVNVVSDLKLRAGWGQNGNQEGVGSYEYLSLNNIDAATGNPYAATIAAQDLTWETTTQTNIGVDATFLSGRLTFTGDFYIKKTKNVLVRVPLSSQIVESILLNMGNMENKGAEFLISSKNIVKKDFTWSTDFNISFNKNKVTSIGNDITFMNIYGSIYERGNSIALVQGYGLGEFYGYVAAGVDPQTGDQLYLSSEGKPTNYSGIKASDRRLIGSAQPDFIYGMTNNLTYKNFDLTIFFQGSQGNKIFNGVRVETEGMKDSRNQSTAVLSRWQNPGDVTDMPGIKANSNDNSQISTRFLENGSYLRFKTITLAYRIDPKVLSHIGLSAASVYVSGQNLITITKYKGFDPEVSTYGTAVTSTGAPDIDNRNVSIGVDYGAYPQPKMILFGLNLSLK
ncbi:SusC/RagA family TonB-linked outer membrane protein [Pinibacter aurantiacus]|uniref:TonB-dependent receptor n=1 Tax=Pinibacter aurantiacus TaxID=2851599 RepID=A0A9E2S9C6_9BACT|nr:TonB-dependent receptor [Pinibacter aurantiacus]MBV4357262.1 TonB-dependent receptor [Pinibacter aurantiacus]